MPFSTTPMAARMSCKNSKRNILSSKIALRPRAAGSYAAKRLCFPAFCATHAQFIIIKHSCMEIKGGRRIAGIFRRKALAPRRRCNMPAGIKQRARATAQALQFLFCGPAGRMAQAVCPGGWGACAWLPRLFQIWRCPACPLAPDTPPKTPRRPRSGANCSSMPSLSGSSWPRRKSR